MFHWKKQNKKVCAEMSRQTMYYSNDKMDSGKQIAIWFIPCTLLVCTSLFATVYSFVGQFSLRAHNSSHLLFFGANFVFYAYCKESLRYTLVYHAISILSRYHCLDSPTYCAFVIQINYSELFPICSYMIHLNFHIFTKYLRRYE